MNFSKSKFLLCIALCATSLINSANASVNTDKQAIHQQKVEGGGTIVMTDIIMAVTVYNDQDHIYKVVVLNSENEPVFQENGCGSNQCSFDLSTVASGNYTAVVYTEQGGSFSATIQR